MVRTPSGRNEPGIGTETQEPEPSYSTSSVSSLSCARGPHTIPCSSTTSRKEVDDARIRTPGRMLDGCAHQDPTTIISFDCCRYMRTLTRATWNIADSV